MIERKLLQKVSDTVRFNDYSNSTIVKISKEFDLRLQYIKVLSSYFNALNSLANRSDTKSIESSSDTLYSSLIGMQSLIPKNDQNAYKDVASGFSAITNFVGDKISQNIQRKYLKMAIDTALPGVVKICALLKSELGSSKDSFLYATNEQQVIVRKIAIRNAENDFLVKEKLDIEILEMIREKDNVDSSYSAAIRLLDNLPKALIEARETLDKKDKNVKDALVKVISEASNLGGYYQKLKSSKN